jgi:hypothetical protein
MASDFRAGPALCSHGHKLITSAVLLRKPGIQFVPGTQRFALQSLDSQAGRALETRS